MAQLYKPGIGGQFKKEITTNKPADYAEKKLELERKEKEDKKVKQKDLTNELQKAYSAIKPTIIQAQRIQKIIDGQYEKILIAKYLNYHFVKYFRDNEAIKTSGYDLDQVGQLSKTIIKDLRDLADLEFKVVEQKHGEDHESEEINPEDDEDDDLEAQSGDEEADSESEEERRKKEEDDAKIQEYQIDIGKLIRNIVRNLMNSPHDYDTIKKLNGVPNDTEMFSNVEDCLTSLRAIYLKKLSTGHDEHDYHHKMLEELRMKIDEHKKIKKLREEEHNKLKLDRAKNNADLIEQITKLKNELLEVKTNEEIKTKAMNKKSEDKVEANRKNHLERENKLEEGLTKARKELEEKRKQNNEVENALKKKKLNAENRLETTIIEYDKEMISLSEETQRNMDIYNDNKGELDRLEEDFRKIKHAKEVNKKLEDEWAVKLQQFEIEENRKKDAAHYIAEMHAAWKERKKKKKKRGGMKNK